MDKLKNFKDDMARGIFGLSITEARDRGICLHCLEPALPRCYSDAGRREYDISGLCEECFDKLFEDQGNG